MPFVPPPRDFGDLGLRAIKSLLTLEGPISTTQRRILDYGQELHQTNYDIAKLEPLSPEELGRLMPADASAEFKREFAQTLVMLSLAGVTVSSRQAAVVKAYARALGVEDPLLDNLIQLSERKLALLRFDYNRRSFPFTKVAEKPQGLVEILRTLGHISGLIENSTVADRYRALEKLPLGSLGRSLFEFYRANNFQLPGEKHGAPEGIVRHDLSHVLSGYSTDLEGELEVVAFQAGYRREGAMELMVFMMFQAQVGMAMVPLAPAKLRALDDEAVGRRIERALRRGAAMTMDPMGDWNFERVFDRPVEELRREYNVLPESEFA